MGYIDRLKNKNPEQQDFYVFGISFGITLFIFVIWVLTIVYGFSAESESNSANSIGPIESITSKVVDLFDGTETYVAE
jgi:hypothetical protein